VYRTRDLNPTSHWLPTLPCATIPSEPVVMLEMVRGFAVPLNCVSIPFSLTNSFTTQPASDPPDPTDPADVPYGILIWNPVEFTDGSWMCLSRRITNRSLLSRFTPS